MTRDQARLAAARLRALREEQDGVCTCCFCVQAEKAAAAVTLGEPLQDPVDAVCKGAKEQPWHVEAPTDED